MNKKVKTLEEIKIILKSLKSELEQKYRVKEIGVLVREQRKNKKEK